VITFHCESSDISTVDLNMVHPTAVIHPGAQLHPTVVVGPYAVIDADVVAGPECWIGPHVHITGRTIIGQKNRFHAGCVIGDVPQDLKYSGEPTGAVIGDGNVFREHVTVHRANRVDDPTTIGSDNYFMSSSHVGHNSHIGNHVIIANGTLLAGHAVVHDRAFISATCMIHQFTRVGALALMQGGSGISKDLPPYTIAVGNNHICGLNTVGLRRAGIPGDQRLELKRLYHHLFRTPGKFSEQLKSAQEEFKGAAAQTLIGFVSESKRGVCIDVSRRRAREESDLSD
jgi:UDP-N-acetylglucosamine acyltransferase